MSKANKFSLLALTSAFNCPNDGFRDWIRGSCFYYRLGGSIRHVNRAFTSITSHSGHRISFFHRIVKFSELTDGSHCYGQLPKASRKRLFIFRSHLDFRGHVSLFSLRLPQDATALTAWYNRSQDLAAWSGHNLYCDERRTLVPEADQKLSNHNSCFTKHLFGMCN